MPTIAVVTGGGSGIGAALGRALVRRGATVALADIDGDAVAMVAERLTKEGPGRAQSAVVDVRNAEGMQRLVTDSHRAYGRLDLLVNNAGVALRGEPEELHLAHWDRLIDVNLRGVIHGCHAAYPLMKDQGGGHIVNVASLAGLLPAPGWLAPYAAPKSAVVGLSLALRAAGADVGVRVSVVCPGWIDTPILTKGGPPDLPVPPSAKAATGGQGRGRLGIKLYPPDRLAEDVLREVGRNKAIIVAPRSARVMRLTGRLAPSLAYQQALLLTRALRRGPAKGAASCPEDVGRSVPQAGTARAACDPNQRREGD
jgi:NAD(P)-dependent dehydrogenase (short-subunit alcohol dehydrogenase family)